ncbi:MAG: hypothetical protein QMD50_02705 [Patescibacteria group bacterium]|nr:hypothetical protein [Patescibacteria group bacterium]
MAKEFKRKIMPPIKTKIFIISPIRNASKEVLEAIKKYVALKENEGCEVYWPYRDRDTDQNDPVGFRICFENGRAIYRADEVHVWYEKGSEGSIFDSGMLFMASIIIGPEKKVVLINKDEVKPTDDKKGFNNVLLALSALNKKHP